MRVINQKYCVVPFFIVLQGSTEIWALVSICSKLLYLTRRLGLELNVELSLQMAASMHSCNNCKNAVGKLFLKQVRKINLLKKERPLVIDNPNICCMGKHVCKLLSIWVFPLNLRHVLHNDRLLFFRLFMIEKETFVSAKGTCRQTRQGSVNTAISIAFDNKFQNLNHCWISKINFQTRTG